ncbi:MAG TPA: hypothetical protein VII35_02400 [Steroidobacteraceae bacterium]
MAEIAEEFAGAAMNEEHLIAVAVAYQVIHVSRGALPEAHPQRRIAEDFGGIPRRRYRLRRQCDEVKGVRTQWAFELHPAGGRVAVVKVRRRAKEAVLTHLAFERAGWQVGVRLARSGSGNAGIAYVALHGFWPRADSSVNLVSPETNGKVSL